MSAASPKSATEMLTGHLNPRGADPDALDDLERHFALALPASYRRFMDASNGAAFPTGKSWVILYPVESVRSETDQHHFLRGWDAGVFIGSDGLDEAYVIDLTQSPPRFGARPYVGAGRGELRRVSATLEEFLAKIIDNPPARADRTIDLTQPKFCSAI